MQPETLKSSVELLISESTGIWISDLFNFTLLCICLQALKLPIHLGSVLDKIGSPKPQNPSLTPLWLFGLWARHPVPSADAPSLAKSWSLRMLQVGWWWFVSLLREPSQDLPRKMFTHLRVIVSVGYSGYLESFRNADNDGMMGYFGFFITNVAWIQNSAKLSYSSSAALPRANMSEIESNRKQYSIGGMKAMNFVARCVIVNLRPSFPELPRVGSDMCLD